MRSGALDRLRRSVRRSAPRSLDAAGAKSGMSLRLTTALQRRGSQLLHQQCHLWGGDVRRPEGNVLLELGFARARPPAGVAGCTQYSRSLPCGRTIRLWGFGFFFGLEDGIYVNRYAFRPCCVSLHEDVWTAQAFSGLSPSDDLRLLAQAVHSIGTLESEIQQAAGIRYRLQLLYLWQKDYLPPREFVQAWYTLAAEIHAHAASSSPVTHRQEPLPGALRNMRSHRSGPDGGKTFHPCTHVPLARMR